MTKLINYFYDWNTWDKAWTILFTITILCLSYIWKENWIAVMASLTGIWCVVLVAKGKTLNYYFGVVNVLAYSYVAYNRQYFGEVQLNMLYYFPMQFIGYYFWKKNESKGTGTVIVKFMRNFHRGVTVAGIAIAVFVYGIWLTYLGGAMPYWDSASTCLSVIACILMTFRYMEQWLLWIIVDLVSIYMWWTAFSVNNSDITVLIMWTAYLINAIYGAYIWYNLYYIQKINKVNN